MAWWSYLADMLWEAVPRALLPRIQSPKQRFTSGESLSHITGYTVQKINDEILSFCFCSVYYTFQMRMMY